MYMFLVFCISTCRQRIVWSLGMAGTWPDKLMYAFLRTCSLSIRQYQQSGIPSIPCIICGHTAIYCWILPTLMNKFGLYTWEFTIFSYHSFSPWSCVTKTKYLNNSALLLKFEKKIEQNFKLLQGKLRFAL